MKFNNLIFTIIIFFFSFSINSQSLTPVQQDSLMTVWNDVNQPDTIRLKVVGRIAKEVFRFKNPDSTFYYAQLQYDLASANNNKEYMVQALNIQGDAYLLKGKPDKAFDLFTSALKISEETGNIKLKISSLENTARVFVAKGDVEKSLEYNLEILKLSEEIQDKESIGKSLLDIGESYFRKGDFPKGIEYLNRSML